MKTADQGRDERTRERVIAHPFFSEMKLQSRAEREAISALESGRFDRVVFLAYGAPGDPAVETTRPGVEIRRLTLRRFPQSWGKVGRIAAYLGWLLQIGKLARDLNAEVVQPHSLAALPVGVFLAKRWDAKVVYDAHEFETERATWGGALRAAARFVEGALTSRVDAVLCVGDTIAARYRERYPRLADRVTTVRNLPMARWRASGPSPLRGALGVGDDVLVCLYLGMFTYGRGLFNAVEAFKRLGDPKKVLVLMGEGRLEAELRAQAEGSPSIRFMPAVPPAEVLSWASGADVGVSLIEDRGLSYRFSLPNKLLEYVSAGVPAITSDLPEAAAFVREHSAGWIVPPTAEALHDTVADLTVESARARRIVDVTRIPSWETESEKLIAVYDRVLAS